MKFLMEHEMGFDTEALGFPSIMGCHAIVYQTPAGLYGFHVAGCSGDDRWGPTASLFQTFIHNHGGLTLTNPGSRLYGSSFVGNNQRGYSSPAKQKWKDELVTYASEVAFTGRISGYDLFKSFDDGGSAYVEYRVKGTKCELFVRKWKADETPARIANPKTADHKVKAGKSLENTNVVDLPTVVTGVSRDNVVRVHKERLR